MKKVLLATVALLIINVLIFAKDRETDFSTIIVDTVSFEDDGNLSVTDQSGNVLVVYNRFENNNIQGLNIKNTRVYDLSGNLLMTIVINIDGTKLQLHLLDKDKKRGLIEFINSVSLGKIKSDVSIQYFGKNYFMEQRMKTSIKGSEISKIVSYDDKIIFKTLDTISMKGKSESIIQIDNSYLKDNQIDAGIWSVILYMCKELNMIIR